MCNFKKALMRTKDSGFTLVELMVVVAIIGILTTLAIPQYQKFQARSRTSEAKVNLAGLHSAVSAVSGIVGLAPSCLELMGFELTGAAANRYYATGFNAGTANDATAQVLAELPGCDQAGSVRAFGGSKMGVALAQADLDATSIPDAGSDAFIAEALGVISSDADTNTAATADRWTINEDKDLTHQRIGY